MIPGFNHNIKHKGRIFHIQTEDSGPKNPHIITHLFVGGNILASKKTTYSEIVGQSEYEKTVRSMMEEQHKQMLRNLINGVYDSIESAPAYYLNGPAPLNIDGQTTSPSTVAMAGPAASPSARPTTVTQELRAGQVPAPMPPPAPGGVGVTPSPVDLRALPPEVAAARALPPEEIPEVKPSTVGTIFGEDLISEKSLDEVILSYLAEDLGDME
jgi:hypothetical protein